MARCVSSLSLPPLSLSPPPNAGRRGKRKLFKPAPVNVQRTPARGPTCPLPLGRHPLRAPPPYAQRTAGWGPARLFTLRDVAVGRQMIWPPLDSRVGVYSLYLPVFSSRFLSLPPSLSPARFSDRSRLNPASRLPQAAINRTRKRVLGLISRIWVLSLSG